MLVVLSESIKAYLVAALHGWQTWEHVAIALGLFCVCVFGGAMILGAGRNLTLRTAFLAVSGAGALLAGLAFLACRGAAVRTETEIARAPQFAQELLDAFAAGDVTKLDRFPERGDLVRVSYRAGAARREVVAPRMTLISNLEATGADESQIERLRSVR